MDITSATSKSFAFPKQNRLLNKAAFDVVFSDAKSSFCRYFTVLYKSNHLENTRMGIICGRKISKKAVDRNRLKRVIRESYRKSSLLQREPYYIDIIVLPKVHAVAVDNIVLFEALEKHWQRIHSKLLKQKPVKMVVADISIQQSNAEINHSKSKVK
jgi:ribonuclease P protein component